MADYIAFLRGINVGGHNVKMDVLCREFETVGLTQVETFIASGNVIFDSRQTDTATLEAKIEQQLRAILNYEVAAFVRTRADVARLADYAAFSEDKLAGAGAYCVAFIKAPLSVAQALTLQQFATDVDEFDTVGREIFWLCNVRQSESKFANAQFERKMGMVATFRSMTTVRKLAAKYPPR
jgi:uncharacterized protein (DUF1697 family)